MLGPGGRVRRGFFPQVPPLFLDLPFLIFHIRACAPRCAGTRVALPQEKGEAIYAERMLEKCRHHRTRGPRQDRPTGLTPCGDPV